MKARPVLESVKMYGKKNPDALFMAFLESFVYAADGVLAKMKECRQIFRPHICRSKGHIEYHPLGCNKRDVCFTCANAYRLSQSAKIEDMFSRMARSSLGNFSFMDFEIWYECEFCDWRLNLIAAWNFNESISSRFLGVSRNAEVVDKLIDHLEANRGHTVRVYLGDIVGSA